MRGHIRTEAGQPLAARIAVGATEIHTDSHGAFTVPNLTPGQYTITITAPGYHSVIRHIALDAGQIEEVNVAMRQLPSDPRVHF